MARENGKMPIIIIFYFKGLNTCHSHNTRQSHNTSQSPTTRHSRNIRGSHQTRQILNTRQNHNSWQGKRKPLRVTTLVRVKTLIRFSTLNLRGRRKKGRRGEKSAKEGKREGNASFESRCFCIPPNFFSQLL